MDQYQMLQRGCLFSVNVVNSFFEADYHLQDRMGLFNFPIILGIKLSGLEKIICFRLIICSSNIILLFFLPLVLEPDIARQEHCFYRPVLHLNADWP